MWVSPICPAGPKTNNPFYVVSWGMAVSRQSKNKALAMDFIKWATSKELAKRGLIASIPMARNSAWADPEARAKANPELVASQAFAAKNGNPFDRPYMSAVGNAATSSAKSSSSPSIRQARRPSWNSWLNRKSKRSTSFSRTPENTASIDRDLPFKGGTARGPASFFCRGFKPASFPCFIFRRQA